MHNRNDVNKKLLQMFQGTMLKKYSFNKALIRDVK